MPGSLRNAGKLGLTTPWARAALTGPDRQDVIDAIPEGWQVGVSVSPNRGQWYLWTVDPEGTIGKRLTVSASMSLRAACFYALHYWKLDRGTVVHIDSLGWVRSIEDA
jgi:hypothetical protein